MEYIKFYICEDCNRRDSYNYLYDKSTACYYCNSIYKISDGNIILNHITAFNYGKEKPVVAKPSYNLMAFIVPSLFIIAGICYILSYFSHKNQGNSLINQNSPPTYQLAVIQNDSTVNDNNEGKSTAFRTYQGKFTIDQNGSVQVDNFSLAVTNNQILYEKSGNVKAYESIYQGLYKREERPGVSFKYHQFYLTGKKIYLLISDRKEVKHLGEFYYRIVIDGQTQLAL